ncbi:hypothetical protein, partial [Nitrosospira sp. NpAV]|uniref:hypothetical protein n=1 Tax=Nitrosospira sp. NpAV TaxID=58133 RepID=UPI0005A0CCE1
EERVIPASGGAWPGLHGGPAVTPVPTCGKNPKPTPKGTIEPKKGKYKDQKVTYHHRTGKHTKVAECPVSELVNATTIDPAQLAGELGRFVQACNAKDRSYGSQLGKEGYDDYGKLMLEALENGNPDAGYRTTASGDIGLHLGGRGCATSATYEVKDDVPNDPKAQFHLYPVS